MIKMNSTNMIIFFFLTLSTKSLQKPIFFKNTFKGLRGVTSEFNFLTYVRAVYYYEQTVAIVDLGVNNVLHDCNLIEI